MFTIGWPQQVCWLGELHLDPEPAQQRHHGLAGVGEHRVVDAGDHQRHLHRRHHPGAYGHERRACPATSRRSASRSPASSPERRGPGPARCPARSPRPVRRPPAGRTRSAISWHSSAFWAPPPTTWTTRDACARTGRRAPATARANASARLSTMLRTRRGRPTRRRRGRARRSTPRSGPACRRAAGTAGPGRRRPCTGPAYGGGLASSGARSSARPRAPRCAASRESSQVPITLVRNRIAAVDAALVGEVRVPGGLGQHRLLELDPDQPPGAAGDVRRVVARHRDADDRRGGVVRADRGDREAGRPTSRRDLPAAAARPPCPGRRARRTAAGARPSRVAQVAVPLPRAHVEQPGRGGVGALGERAAGQPVADQVGDQQQPVRRRRPSGSAASW